MNHEAEQRTRQAGGPEAVRVTLVVSRTRDSRLRIPGAVRPSPRKLVAYHCLSIGITAVCHVEYHDRHDLILNVADEPIVTHPVLLKLAEDRPVERPSQAVGILQGRNPL